MTTEQAILIERLMGEYRWPWRYDPEAKYDDGDGYGFVLDADGRTVAENVEKFVAEWLVNLVNDTASPDQVSLALRA